MTQKNIVCGGGRTPAADPPQNPSLCRYFHVFEGLGAGKDEAKIIRGFWKSISARFSAIVLRFLAALRQQKRRKIQCFYRLCL